MGALEFIPILLSCERFFYILPDVQERIDKNWMVLNRYVYDVMGLFGHHPSGPAGIKCNELVQHANLILRTLVAKGSSLENAISALRAESKDYVK